MKDFFLAALPWVLCGIAVGPLWSMALASLYKGKVNSDES